MATPRPERDALAARVRAILAAQPLPVTEKPMFGAQAFLVDGGLAVTAGKAGDLLVRVERAHRDELLDRPGAREAVMGKGRSMGADWLEVSAAALDDAALTEWVTEGVRARKRSEVATEPAASETRTG